MTTSHEIFRNMVDSQQTVVIVGNIVYSKLQGSNGGYFAKEGESLAAQFLYLFELKLI